MVTSLSPPGWQLFTQCLAKNVEQHLALFYERNGQLLEVVGRRPAAHEGLHLRVLDAVHVER